MAIVTSIMASSRIFGGVAGKLAVALIEGLRRRRFRTEIRKRAHDHDLSQRQVASQVGLQDMTTDNPRWRVAGRAG